MADKPPEDCWENYLAVRLKNLIIVLSQTFSFQIRLITSEGKFFSMDHYTIWIYCLWTEQWKKYSIPKQRKRPFIDVHGRTSVVVGSDVYIFGGHDQTTMFCKLIRHANGSFDFSIIHNENQTKIPSPRMFHCSWEHGEKMWVFGGYGPSPVDYLNDHGDFIQKSRSKGNNNQLLSYYPSTNTWTNVECSGEVPSPRRRASTASIQDNVWLYGGSTEKNRYCNNLYELNMHSFKWTKIETTMLRPGGSNRASLTPISSSHLVLYGGIHEDWRNKNLTKPWIFDVQSHTWRQHPAAQTHRRWNHEGIIGLNSSVIILGGEMKPCKGALHHQENTFYVMLEPKSLQQLVIQMLYNHRSTLSLENLPNKLTCKIMFQE